MLGRGGGSGRGGGGGGGGGGGEGGGGGGGGGGGRKEGVSWHRKIHQSYRWNGIDIFSEQPH